MDIFISSYLKNNETNSHILDFFKVFSRYIVIIILLIWFLSNIGFDVTSFIAGLGIFSLAIAYALKEVIADIFASIVIFIDRPYEKGDSVKIDSTSGTVEQVGIRSSKIRSADGFLVIASNRELTSKRIHNMKKMNQRRVSLKLQVSQSLKIETMKKIENIVVDVLAKISTIEFDKVSFVNIGDYSYDFDFVYFVKSRDFRAHMDAKHEILLQILQKFKEEGINLPFPTKTIILDE